jgi:hypothetical protein
MVCLIVTQRDGFKEDSFSSHAFEVSKGLYQTRFGNEQFLKLFHVQAFCIVR